MEGTDFPFEPAPGWRLDEHNLDYFRYKNHHDTYDIYVVIVNRYGTYDVSYIDVESRIVCNFCPSFLLSIYNRYSNDPYDDKYVKEMADPMVGIRDMEDISKFLVAISEYVTPMYALRRTYHKLAWNSSHLSISLGQAYRGLRRGGNVYDILPMSILSNSSPRTSQYRPDVTDRVLRHFFGDDYGKRPTSDLSSIDSDELYLYGAKESGYDATYLVECLGHELMSICKSNPDEMFDVMAREVELDPLSYVDDDKSMFRDYARQLVSVEEA